MKWRREPGVPTPREAMQLQRELARRVVRRGSLARVELVAGADASVRDERVHVAIVVMRLPALEVVEVATEVRPCEFPYVPGLLGFREVPTLLRAYAKLTREPDVVLVDGHGLAHPRRFGIATHLGVALDRPTIGVGKSRLVGEHREPGARRGCRTRLLHDGEAIGVVLRTQPSVRPVYVSIGHRVELDAAVRLVLRCARRYRLPEPIRAADRAAGELERGERPPPPRAPRGGVRGGGRRP